MALMQKWSPNPPLVWQADDFEREQDCCQNACAVFLSIWRHSRGTRWACLIIDGGGREKNSLLVIRLGYWAMTSRPPGAHHGTVHLARLSSRSKNWFISHIRLRSRSCRWIFCHHHFDPWKVNCCCVQWRPSLFKGDVLSVYVYFVAVQWKWIADVT